VKPVLLRMAGRDEVRIVKPVFVGDGEPIAVWELVKLNNRTAESKAKQQYGYEERYAPKPSTRL